jgi:protein-L-isoaspartate(D-aspartate) O-methyltransferase
VRAAGDGQGNVTVPGSGHDGRAAQARHGMVDALAAAGAVTSPAVLGVLRRVPREDFVPRFWSAPPGVKRGNPDDVREWHVADDGDDALSLVYNIDRALAIRGQRPADSPTGSPRVTSTVSAPRVVGSMLELLDIAPGMRILEIGTGSGYNAALLSELAGPAGSVTSVDIDAGLVAETSARMAAIGYPGVRLVAADGYFGLPDHAPFDRIVATVGCVDVAPAWLDQLADGGFCLLPLLHDGWHPLIRVEPSPGEATGRIVGFTGFVAIQGRQAGYSPWPRSGRPGPIADVDWAALPGDLAAELRLPPGEEEPDEPRSCDLAYLLALEDARAACMLSLLDDGSSAVISAREGRIGWAGPGGPALRDRLLEIADRWAALGWPSMRDYRSRFLPLTGDGMGEGTGEPAGDSAQWIIRRLDFAQVVSLRGAGTKPRAGDI